MLSCWQVFLKLLGESVWIAMDWIQLTSIWPSGLVWKACLKKTRVRSELLLDPDMLLMFGRGFRGGITQSVHRWAKANNPYMGSEYINREPTRYLQYLDANSLYGWAMSQPLPTEGFHWADIHPDEISKLEKLQQKRIPTRGRHSLS